MLRLMPLFAVAGVMLVMVMAYMGYDYASSRASPCETIFRQTSLGLETKISFLKTEGQVKIGRQPVAELTERAQMTALNLKTCCTVLDAGRLDPEQFLQCKSKVRAYDTKLSDIITEVKRIVEAERRNARPDAGGSGQSSAAIAAEPKAVVALASAKARIAKDMEEARGISQSLSQEVIQVRREQAIETLKLVPPQHVQVSAQEREPNNDGLNTNLVPLGTWVSAAISSGGDADFFSFETPPTYRDRIKVELDNRSTTLEPRIELFNTNKASMGEQHNTTPGANSIYQFVSEPGQRYLARVSNYYGKSTGGYLLRVVATKSYDRSEPNDSILSARKITAGTTVEAAIMDGKDEDYFQIDVPAGTNKIEAKLTNKSTTLRPRIEIFHGNKTSLGSTHNTTGGSDLTYSLAVKPSSAFYIRVSDYYGGAAGAYGLTVDLSQ